MATYSSTLAWKIPWIAEPGRLQSMGSLGVGHDWKTSLSLFTFMYWRRKWQPTPVFLPGESQGRGNLAGCRLWGCTESDITEVIWQQQQQDSVWVFPGDSVVRNPPVNAGDAGLIPESGRSPGGGYGNSLQYSCLENPMDRGAWWATVHGAAKSQTWLKQLSTHARPFPTVCSCLSWRKLIHLTHVIYFLGSLFCSIDLCLFLCQYCTTLIIVAL